jgi:hypothetical protein
MTQLLDFYRGDARDGEGRLLTEIWAWNDDEWEAVHDFIQWLFPLPEPSQFNPHAPLLTDQDITAFRADNKLQANLRRSFERFLTFLGLAQAPDGRVGEGANFRVRVQDAWAAPNHNWLRITRVLRSLSLLGRAADARTLYDYLDTLYSSRRFPITAQTFRYWRNAVGDQERK